MVIACAAARATSVAASTLSTPACSARQHRRWRIADNVDPMPPAPCFGRDPDPRASAMDQDRKRPDPVKRRKRVADHPAIVEMPPPREYQSHSPTLSIPFPRLPYRAGNVSDQWRHYRCRQGDGGTETDIFLSVVVAPIEEAGRIS